MSGGTGPGGIDEDAARVINDGRETAGVMLRTAQLHLQKAFIAFTVGMLGGIVLMRAYVWPALKADLLVKGATVIAQTPFDVILLQVKIGLGLGIVFALPVLLYYARDPLRERGIVPELPFSRRQLVLIGAIALVLAVAGAAYAYVFFFPLLFEFLARNAINSGLVPRYSIVHWTEFIVALSAAFAAAAELPLVMTSLTYAGVVSPRTWRAYWRHAVLAIVLLGTVINGSPEPFSAMLVALPMILLYAIGVYTSRAAARVTSEVETSTVALRTALRRRWNVLAALAVVGAGAGYAASRYTTADAALATRLGASPAVVRGALLVAGLVVAVALGVAAVAFFARRDRTPPTVTSGRPNELDVSALDAAGVRAAPPEAFASMSEEDALAHARAAMDEGDAEKAEAILDRFDEVSARQELEEGETAGVADAGGAAAATAGEADDAGSSGTITRTTTGIVDAFTEEETTEEDIGGYYHDVAFVLDSLRSRAFRLIALFMIVLAGTFAFLYRGGIRMIQSDFLSRIPAEVRPNPAQTDWPITLHPVEALVFEVKISIVFATIAILPFLLYYAWPALEERGIVTGDKRTIAVWGGSIAVTLVAGSALGYMYVAPEVISFLVADALRAGMAISYRVNNFFWMVFLTTAGIGLLTEIPVSMVLFHYGGIVSFETMYARWRVAVLSAFAFGALVTPDSLYTMLLIGIPIALAYLAGLGVLWVATLGGRRGGGRSTGTQRPT